ncbi:hypothetical protein GCM10009551_065800 [Nocardiopsis tropica]
MHRCPLRAVAYFVTMGYPDPQQNPGQHPGGQNYPAQPGGPVPPQQPGGPYPPAQPGGPYPPAQPGGYQPTREMGREETGGQPGGYELGYAPGAYGPYDGQQPPQGPPPGDPYGPGGPGGGDGGDGNKNKKVLWIAVATVIFVLVLAGVVVGVATSGSKETAATTTATPTTTATRTTTKAPATGGTASPSFSLPNIFGGGSTTGPNARQWQVEVSGTGSAQLVTIGIPDTSLFGSQPLPWSKTFSSDAALVNITVIGYTGDVTCKITRNGTVVSEQKSSAEGTGGGPLICSSGR